MSGDPSLAFQKALRALLTGNAGVTALCPADNIMERSARPERFPCVIIGDGAVQHARPYERFFEKVLVDLHCWNQEDGLASVKALAGAVYDALNAGPWTVIGFRLCNAAVNITRTRFLRDPDREHSHAVISIEAMLQ